MENLINSKIDKQTIYDIYRACRLCGAGAGYKMPIIQTVVDLDANGVELKQKIRDCVQIEVNSDDKMPPLICELCVDKVNDFYEFMDMCQQTNKRTRLRLGLPPQSTGKVRNANYDSGDCILGVTEQVFGNDDSDEPLSASSSQRPKAEHKVKIKVEKLENTRDNRSRPESGKETKSRHENSRETRSRPDNSRNFRHRLESKESRSECSRESRSRPRNRECSGSRSPSLSPRQTRRKRPPTPPRRTRHGGSTNADIEEYTTLNNLKHQVKNLSSKSLPQPPKSILKMDIKSEDASKSKRCREPSKPDVPQKKVKLSVPPPRARPSRKPSPPPPHACMVCRKGHATSQALSSHVRVHTVTYTPVKLSCNACEEWFPTVDEAVTHHRVHKLKNRPYRCRRCRTKFKLQQGYDDHITNSECVPWTEAPLVKCPSCWRLFPTRTLLEQHKCGGADCRPGGRCALMCEHVVYQSQRQGRQAPSVKCPSCWRLFPTRTLLEQHKCGGADCRPGGKCMKCKRTYALLKNLKKHEETCSAKRKSEPIIDPAVRARLLPAAVRLWRCDPLLRGGRCHASRATQEYGFDPLCVYPYRRRRELAANLMVNIKAELDEFYDEEDYVHWDSECSEDEESAKSVCSLTTLALKTIFSRRCLGRVPRKRRKVKTESNAFDSVLNASGFDDIRSDIDNIIDNLGKDDDDYTDINKLISERKDNDSINSESLLCDAAGDKSEDFTAINDTDSQSLFSDGRNDEKHERTGVRELSVDESKVDNDSTDGDKTKVSRLSGECNDVNDKTDLISNNDKELSNHYFDNASTNSDLDNDDEARQTNDDCSGHHTRTDGQTNGDVDGKDNVTIGDDLVNHENTQSQLDTTNSNENHNETTVSENNEIMNEQVNAKTVNSTTHNTSTDSVSEVDQIERNHRDENAAICNDIENKINDLVSFNNSGENDYNGEIVNNDRFSVNETGASDELTPHCNVNTDEEKEELSLNTNIIDKDKITLDDLIPANDRETKSMDLDSISDGEFDFDA